MKAIKNPEFNLRATFQNLYKYFVLNGEGTMTLEGMIDSSGRFFQWDYDLHRYTYVDRSLGVIAVYLERPNTVSLPDETDLPMLIQSMQNIDCFVADGTKVKAVV